MKKLTNEDIDKRLINIKRLEDHINCNSKINFQCLVDDCNYIWSATPGNILSGKGCPKCAGILPLTNEIVDQRLSSRNIKRVGDIVNSQTPVKFVCEKCHYGERGEWKVRPNHLVNDRTGCPKCAKVIPLTNEIVDSKLEGRRIKRLDNYDGIDTSIHFQCLVCNYGSHFEWKTSPNNILNGEKGCPNCKLGKNEKLVQSILEENGIVFEQQKYLKDIANIDRRFHVDFYLPQHNVIIEYNGQQHYELVCFGSMSKSQAQIRLQQQKDRDAFVRQFCMDNSIYLIWIDGRKYTNSKLKKYMMNKVIPALK